MGKLRVNDPWTTWPGIVVLTISIILYVLDYTGMLEKPVNNWVNVPMIGLGCLLVVAKDVWVKVVATAFNRFFKKMFS
jgi:hypothetical protein